jgi:hypothetical protein
VSIASLRSKAAKWRTLADAAVGLDQKEALNHLAVLCNSQADQLEQSLARQRSSAMDDKVYDEAGKVSAEDGVVHVDGPDSVDVHLTPDAALEISDQILSGALTARGQQAMREQEEARRATLKREIDQAASKRPPSPKGY